MKVKRINMSAVGDKETAFSDTPWVDATVEENELLKQAMFKMGSKGILKSLNKNG